MAHISKAARKMARTRRGSSLQQRQYASAMRQMNAYAKQMQGQHVQFSRMLLALLTQVGGSVTITQATLDDVQAKRDRLSWRTDPGTVEGELVVSVVETASPSAAPDATDVTEVT